MRIHAAANRWAFRQPPHHKTKDRLRKRAEKTFISIARDWLRFIGRLHIAEVPPPSYSRLVAQFADFLKQEKGLSPHTTDIRDRAILLLLAVYGLRSAEVRGLQLEDLQWEQELPSIARPKQRKKQLYPLSESVGEAILRYLKKVRPRVRYREVFLTLQAPIKPLSASGLWHLVGRRLRALGVSARKRGPHSLRHACATHLLAQDFSMKEIGDYLGHQCPEATRVYAKVDLAGLRRVADFDLGGVA